MKYFSVAEIAKKWNISERSVRNYCAIGRVEGAFLTGKTWNIPENAKRPERTNKKNCEEKSVLEILKAEKINKCTNGIYNKTQIELTYNSGHIEGSKLTYGQTKYIFETNTIEIKNEILNVDDVIEASNHFRCVDIVIDNAKSMLSEKFLKELHLILKMGTSDSRNSNLSIGDYKKEEKYTCNTYSQKKIGEQVKELLLWYLSKKQITLDDIIEFHVRFEALQPFKDGNGRIGRLIMFKECLKHNIMPFIISEHDEKNYLMGIECWNEENSKLKNIIIDAQSTYNMYLNQL